MSDGWLVMVSSVGRAPKASWLPIIMILLNSLNPPGDMWGLGSEVDASNSMQQGGNWCAWVRKIVHQHQTCAQLHSIRCIHICVDRNSADWGKGKRMEWCRSRLDGGWGQSWLNDTDAWGVGNRTHRPPSQVCWLTVCLDPIAHSFAPLVIYNLLAHAVLFWVWNLIVASMTAAILQR